MNIIVILTIFFNIRTAIAAFLLFLVPLGILAAFSPIIDAILQLFIAFIIVIVVI